jgi:hypothetical protein
MEKILYCGIFLEYLRDGEWEVYGEEGDDCSAVAFFPVADRITGILQLNVIFRGRRYIFNQHVFPVFSLLVLHMSIQTIRSGRILPYVCECDGRHL